METLITVNVLILFYIFVTMKVAVNRRANMTDGAYHHLISHILLVVLTVIAIDLYVIKGYIIPIILVLLYLLQHVTKENLRLLKTNRWTPTVHDELEPTA